MSPTFNLKSAKVPWPERWWLPSQRGASSSLINQRVCWVLLVESRPKTGDIPAKRPLLLRKDLSKFPPKVGPHGNMKQQSGLNRCWSPLSLVEVKGSVRPRCPKSTQVRREAQLMEDSRDTSGSPEALFQRAHGNRSWATNDKVCIFSQAPVALFPLPLCARSV